MTSSGSNDSSIDVSKGPTMQNNLRSKPYRAAWQPTLNEVLKNTTPPPYSLGAFINYLTQIHCLETLEFILEVNRYREGYKSLVESAGESITTTKVLKACQTTMQSAALLEKEVSELRAKNERKKRKRTRSIRQIPAEEGLLVLEASSLILQLEQAILAQVPYEVRPTPAPLQPRTRALPKCGACGIEGHKRNACPDRRRF
jgi:hypothetical protein